MTGGAKGGRHDETPGGVGSPRGKGGSRRACITESDNGLHMGGRGRPSVARGPAGGRGHGGETSSIGPDADGITQDVKHFHVLPSES